MDELLRLFWISWVPNSICFKLLRIKNQGLIRRADWKLLFLAMTETMLGACEVEGSSRGKNSISSNPLKQAPADVVSTGDDQQEKALSFWNLQEMGVDDSCLEV